ncbi:MAG: cation diffusion facilitator family transporter [Candidatus Lokiarchaeota archaeon]|jgi:cation diffusion facilitator family transporter
MNDIFYKKPVFLNLILLIVNLGLFISKLIFSILTNSLALQADAFDSLTDIFMALVAFIGLIYANKKPNEKFPYGYYKIENIISLVISLFIFFTAYNIIMQAFSDFTSFFAGNPIAIRITPEVFIFLFISLGISMFLTVYLKNIGKYTGSPIIQSQASEKVYDNLVSSSVIINFIVALFGFYFTDPIIGLIIAAFIIKGGYDMFIQSTKTLLDAVIDFENRKELYDLIANFSKVKEIEKLEVRSYGKYIFVEVNIILNKELLLHLIEDMKKAITEKVKSRFPQIFRIIIITQASKKQSIRVAVPITENEDLDSPFSEHFGEAGFFALLDFAYDKTRVLSDYQILTNKYKDVEKRKGILISDWLVSEKIDKVYLRKELNKGPSLIFENSFVQVISIESENLREIINREIENP